MERNASTDRIKKIVDFFEEVIAKYNIPKNNLERNGAIFYMNENDSTDFDWQMNDRLCEFGIGVADGSVYAFKLLIDKSGEATMYCYPNGEQHPVETITKQLFYGLETARLKDQMEMVADDRGEWNKTLEELGYEI